MTVLTQDDRFVEALETEGGKPKNMCELLDRVEAKGREEGREEGRMEGRMLKQLLEQVRELTEQLAALQGVSSFDALLAAALGVPDIVIFRG